MFCLLLWLVMYSFVYPVMCLCLYIRSCPSLFSSNDLFLLIRSSVYLNLCVCLVPDVLMFVLWSHPVWLLPEILFILSKDSSLCLKLTYVSYVWGPVPTAALHMRVNIPPQEEVQEQKRTTEFVSGKKVKHSVTVLACMA